MIQSKPKLTINIDCRLQPCRHCSRLPCHLVTLSLCHLATLSPCHLVTLQPCRHCSRLPCHLVTLSHCHLVTLSPCHLATLSPCSIAAIALASLVTGLLVAIPRDQPLHGEGGHHWHYFFHPSVGSLSNTVWLFCP